MLVLNVNKITSVCYEEIIRMGWVVDASDET